MTKIPSLEGNPQSSQSDLDSRLSEMLKDILFSYRLDVSLAEQSQGGDSNLAAIKLAEENAITRFRSVIKQRERLARINEISYLSGYKQKTTHHHGGWATGVSTSRMNTRLDELQAEGNLIDERKG